MKTCCRCHQDLPLDSFHRASSTKDGRQRCCKACTNAYKSSPEAKARIRAYGIKRYAEKRDWYLERNRQWYAEHYAEIRERRSRQAAEWNKANPEKRREIVTRRRLAARGIGSERIDRAAIFERDGFRCHLCGGHVPEGERTLDHLVPLSKGGTHRADNVRLAHHRCNASRGAGRAPAQLLLLG